jgi:hypothetical protein
LKSHGGGLTLHLAIACSSLILASSGTTGLTVFISTSSSILLLRDGVDFDVSPTFGSIDPLLANIPVPVVGLMGGGVPNLKFVDMDEADSGGTDDEDADVGNVLDGGVYVNDVGRGAICEGGRGATAI